MLTGRKDLDRIILSLLDDPDLLHYALSGRSRAWILKDEIFWMNRFKKRFGDTDELPHISWKENYKYYFYEQVILTPDLVWGTEYKFMYMAGVDDGVLDLETWEWEVEGGTVVWIDDGAPENFMNVWEKAMNYFQYKWFDSPYTTDVDSDDTDNCENEYWTSIPISLTRDIILASKNE